MHRHVAAIAGAVVLAMACSRLTGPSPLATLCNPTAATANQAFPFFIKPFAGDFPNGNLFDHDKPIGFDDGNGRLVSMCGVTYPLDRLTDGHDGYDWRMPEGTPIRAVADGRVEFAGIQQPFNCPPLGRAVQAIYVQLRHAAPDAVEFITIYGHLSRVTVSSGDVIAAGTVVGLSGNTGCSGTPHLHFGVFKGRNGNFALIDPYGWHATSPDPWETDPRGTSSVWLWRDGEAPSLR